jgi:lipopolysaccharide/colanic/teichoic acid biosynthesis glycosyltransferase
VKRVVDVVFGAVILVALSPVMAAAALIVRLTSRGPILFRQTRSGLHGEPFEMLKFRSMRTASDESIHQAYVTQLLTADPGAQMIARKLQRDPRITRWGALMRRFSIDELPQLINVLRGEMSLVGPRPALPYEVELYNPEHLRRLDVRPGLTGLWQVSGRNMLTMIEMLELDVRYVETLSVRLDFRIICETVRVIIRGDGAA